MEKIQESSGGNAYVKNVFFCFENILPTKSKKEDNKNNNSISLKNNNKIKRKKKSKSREKIKKPEKKTEKNNIIAKPIHQEEENIINNKKKSNKNSKQKKKKSKNKEKFLKQELNNDNVIDNHNKEIIEDNSKSKGKKKKKSKSKSKNKEKKKKSKIKEIKTKGIQTTVNHNNNDILDYIEIEPPKYNEIKDDAMNEVQKHIYDLSSTFMKPRFDNKEINFSKTFLKSKKEKKKKTKDNKTNKKGEIINLNNIIIQKENEIINKRPYTAHGYKVRSKSKTKKLTKTIKPNKEEEKIIAFKEKVYVHDKILSLFNNFNIIDKNEENNKLIKTQKPRVKSALTKKSDNDYMMPKQKDILKQKNIKKKEIQYFDDKYEEDPEEIKTNEKEQNEIRNKNNKAIYLIKKSNKIYGKSQQSISDIRHILNKNNMNTFINNFLIKHNFDLKKEENKLNNNYDIPNITYYHGGKEFYRPKTPRSNNKLNNSDSNILKNKNDKKYKLFNPKEIISNPNNKFNFFNQTFTKEPIYGKFIESPEIEKNFNNNLSTIPSNKWNPRYKIKTFIKEEKENPNDVYNYDYKYDDLNSDSDNELPNTDFKANKMPKFNKVKYDYRNYKNGKLIKEKNNNKLKENENYMDKNIFHPFLINDDIVNI